MRSGRLLDWAGRAARGWQRESRQLAGLVRRGSTRRTRRAVAMWGLAAIIGILLFAWFALQIWLPRDGMGRNEADSNPAIEVHFSPGGGCTDAILQEIGNARSTILVQAYSFTSAAIAKTLVEAQRRGVNVAVILDGSRRTEKYSEADFLIKMGIPIWFDAKHSIAHNKVMVIDREVVLTGSFNFTKAAEDSNAENLVVIRDRAVAERYAANWESHRTHSELYGGR